MTPPPDFNDRGAIDPVRDKSGGGVSAKWYHKTSMILLAFACVGPLALPLVWINPRYDPAKKILGTVLMLAATWLLWIWMKDSFDRLMAQYKELKASTGL